MNPLFLAYCLRLATFIFLILFTLFTGARIVVAGTTGEAGTYGGEMYGGEAGTYGGEMYGGEGTGVCKSNLFLINFMRFCFLRAL